MTPDDILKDALAIIERDGWHRGGLYDGVPADVPSLPDCEMPDDYRYDLWQAEHNAPVCSIGAINRAFLGTAQGYDAGHAVYENLSNRDFDAWSSAINRLATAFLGRPADLPSTVIANSNDDESTTREDVVLAFKRAIHGEVKS